MSSQRQRALLKLGFFTYGALSHLLLFRLYVRWAYIAPARPAVANHPLTNLAVALLGGGFVFLLLPGPLVKAATKSPGRVLPVIGKGALCSLLATCAAVQALFVLGALYSALWVPPGMPQEPDGMGVWDMFLLGLIEIETYGGDIVFLSLPFAAFSGMLCGGLVIWLSRYLRGT